MAANAPLETLDPSFRRDDEEAPLIRLPPSAPLPEREGLGVGGRVRTANYGGDPCSAFRPN